MTIKKNKDGANYSTALQNGIFPVLWKVRRTIEKDWQFNFESWLTQSRFEVDITTVPDNEKFLYQPIRLLTYSLELLEISDEFQRISDEDKGVIHAVDALIPVLCGFPNLKLISYEINAEELFITALFEDSDKNLITKTITETGGKFTKAIKDNAQLVQGMFGVCLKQAAIRNQFYAQILSELVG